MQGRFLLIWASKVLAHTGHCQSRVDEPVEVEEHAVQRTTPLGGLSAFIDSLYAPVSFFD
jgi:hypothetical protein